MVVGSRNMHAAGENGLEKLRLSAVNLGTARFKMSKIQKYSHGYGQHITRAHETPEIWEEQHVDKPLYTSYPV